MSMSSKNAPAPEIMNVREIIEYAFGDFEENTVNFKLLQTVLFLIARQLRLLERRVEIEFGPLHILPSNTTLSVTEVKIHAIQKKKQPVKKSGAKPGLGRAKPGEAGTKPGVGGAKAGTKPSWGGAKLGEAGAKSGLEGAKLDETGTKFGVGGAKPGEVGTKRGVEGAEPGQGRDKLGSPKGRKIDGGTKSFPDKTYTDKSSIDKTSSDKTSTDKTSTDKTSSTDKTASSGKTTSTGEQTSTDKTSSSDKTTSSGKMTSSGEKSSADKTTSSGIMTSSGEKSSTDKTTSSGTMTTSGEKSSTDKTTSGGKMISSGEKTSTDKTTSMDKNSNWKTSSSDKTSTNKTSSSRMSSLSKDAVDKQQQPYDFRDTLETFEEQSEKVLRYIHQRADSLEQGKKDGTPFASLTSVNEAQYEKLLVVKKVPSKEARETDNLQGKRTPPLISLVTQEQFEELADLVRALEKKLLPVGTPGFPEHAELMEELRRGASLTDAMAALQLSARLEATEKALHQMMSMVTELALGTPGVELDSDTRAYLGLSGGSAKKGFDPTGRAVVSEGGNAKKRKGAKSKESKRTTATSSALSETDEVTESEPQASGMKSKTVAPEIPEAQQSKLNQYVTFIDLQAAAREVCDEILKKVKTVTSRTSTTATNAYKLAVKLESKLDSAINVSAKMADLENLVKQYAEQINALDTGLSSQMTNYQEQLTQMQHDLEIGLDNMAEVFGNTGGDVEAMAELHTQFTGLQVDLESMAFRQKELKDAQDSTSYDLENLWKEIEMLRDTKSDREEVADALRDKAGIGELNGLVSLQQFEAVRSDYEKRIATAYDTFNNQEFVWQKAIDDFLKMLYEKADMIQVQSLKDEIQKHLNIMRGRIQIIADVVGEPKSAILAKKVFRDSACLACGSPAYMDMEEANKVPALPKFPSARQPAEGADAESQVKGGGDNRPCYPDLPIPHPRDPRSHICKRFCGGSHTVVTDGLNRAPQSLVVQPQRPFNTAPGTDGKLYMVDEATPKVPCLACNKMSKSSPFASYQPAPDMVFCFEDFSTASIDSFVATGNLTLTPPAQDISYN